MSSKPDLTFAVHPRPPEAMPKLSEPVLDLSPPVGPPPPVAAVANPSDDRDTFLANLAFLVRFAFGRY
ncbi:hypothetical protein [Lichenibacterium ramalinae]|uniref:Uncharacterized protein n=1 Tax=Lichenibacterium ramalinae TaxID=2316527 RepID=A0A4Q2R745_9HYPH|nr:hypothetical protein [Lichenibacterium ramalinae]RYB02421.1 hypothetical protein D3272_21065 [Lichenibacterium ramalinae]